MKNQRKEGDFYATKVRLFLNEYDGSNLENSIRPNVSITPRCAIALIVFHIVSPKIIPVMNRYP